MWIESPVDLSDLPREPGIYRMLDQARKVLYIGKARNLRKRVTSYFQKQPDSPRIQSMVSQIRDIEISVTPSEAEALILEHNLIKQLKPRYNVLLKDSKTYPYILLTRETYPRLQLYRGSRSTPGEYFGPFPNAHAVHATLHSMQKVFQIRDCENSVFANRSRPCLQHQIGRCTAPCCDLVDQKTYGEQVQQVRQFLKGQDDSLINQWQEAMQQASASMQFELAALWRDRIRALRSIQAGSQKNGLPNQADAIVLVRQATGVLAAVGVRRSGRDLGTHTIRIDQGADADDLEILQFLLIERYRHETPPAELIIDTSDAHIEELQRLMRLMGHRKTQLLNSKRGDKATWLQQVHYAAGQSLASRSARDQQPAFEALAELLDLEETPELVAAVDNAHLGGQQTVAAIVYGGWQGPVKDYYRRYKLDDHAHGPNVPEGDDYEAMRQVLGRFYRAIAAEEIPCPDVMLIDGGKGQLSIAMACAAEHGLDRLRMVGVAKGVSRKLGEETLWPSWQGEVANIGNPLKPGRHSPALLLIARVRDEAHRFAGEYMRNRKKKKMLSSQLDQIAGIGPAKRAALLKHFGGIEGVKKASREQLSEAPGVSNKLAEQIFQKLHQ